MLFDPNIYTINGNVGVGVLHSRKEERNNVSFKSCHLHESLLWKKKRNNLCSQEPLSNQGKEGLGGVISSQSP